MIDDLFVEFFVPTLEGENTGTRGTGYPVARGLILTAHHVLYPDNRDPQQPIKFRWHQREGEEREWQSIGDEDIAWENNDPFDAALIRCTFPEDVRHVGLLSEQKPAEDAFWRSRGFASAGKVDGWTELVPMKGDILFVDEKKSRIHLGVKYEPKEPDQGAGMASSWAGASGSPMFVGSALVGVITTRQANFREKRLFATPLWQLLKDDIEFRKLVGLDNKKERIESIIRNTAKIFQESPESLNALRGEIPPELLKQNENSPVGLTKALLSMSVDKLMLSAIKAQRRSSTDSVAESICQSVEALLPAVIDESVVNMVCDDRNNLELAIIQLPTDLETVAEVIMAAVDQRPAKFNEPTDEMEFPFGSNSVEPPEVGWNSTLDHFKSAWDDHFANEFLKEKQRGYVPETLARMVSNYLRRKAEDGYTRYVVLNTREDSSTEELEASKERYSEIKKKYPDIVFLYLGHDDERVVAETDMYQRLSSLLINANRKRHQTT